MENRSRGVGVHWPEPRPRTRHGIRSLAGKAVVAHHSLSRGACAFALAVGLAYAASNYEDALNVPGPAVLRVAAPLVSTGSAKAARVVWVLVDGLRLDASRRMTALNRLR